MTKLITGFTQLHVILNLFQDLRFQDPMGCRNKFGMTICFKNSHGCSEIKKILTIFFVVVCLLLVGGLRGTREARAQSLSLSLSPPVLEVMIKPGKSITQVFKLSNEGEPVYITPRLLEYTENGVRENKDFTAEPWINFLPGTVALNQSFLLRTGETRGLVLRINPPADTAESNFYRVLLFSTNPNPPSQFSQSQVQSQIGSIILLNVTSTGMQNKQAIITSFLFPKSIDSFGPLKTAIEVTNVGKTYFRPIGEITLTGPLGKASYKINPEVFLAKQTKILTTTPPSDSSQKAKNTLDLTGFFIGKYTLSVDFTLDEGTIKLSEKKVFYALPWKAGIVFLLIFLMWFIIRKSKNNRRERAR